MEHPLFETVDKNLKVKRLHFDVLDSTQLYCKRNLSQYIESDIFKKHDFLIISCNSQTNGIGTRNTKDNVDRIWLSEKGNVFVTFVFLWSKNDLEKAKCLAQTSTVAVSKTIESYLLITQIKWINDVMINEKKVAGSLVNLVDSNITIGPQEYYCALVGIGINVDLIDKNNILQIEHTCLKKELIQDFGPTAKIPSPEDVIQLLMKKFVKVINQLKLEGFIDHLNYITLRLLYANQDVVVDQDNTQISGRLLEMFKDGSLIIMTYDGKIMNVNTGHLRLRNKTNGH